MGWAKYYEDNMSIHIGRMAVREVTPVFYERPKVKIAPEVKLVVPEERNKAIVAEKHGRVHKSLGRKGGNSSKRGQAFRTNGALSPILSVRSTALYR